MIPALELISLAKMAWTLGTFIPGSFGPWLIPLLGASFLAGIALYLTAAWPKTGGPVRHLQITPQRDPPAGVSPVAARLLEFRTSDTSSRTAAAIILSLAVKGYLRIQFQQSVYTLTLGPKARAIGSEGPPIILCDGQLVDFRQVEKMIGKSLPVPWTAPARRVKAIDLPSVTPEEAIFLARIFAKHQAVPLQRTQTQTLRRARAAV